MWGVYAHLVATHGYHCARCNVFGNGETCWACGSSRWLNSHVRVPPTTGGAHRYNPTARSVHFPGGDVPIEEAEVVTVAV